MRVVPPDTTRMNPTPYNFLNSKQRTCWSRITGHTCGAGERDGPAPATNGGKGGACPPGGPQTLSLNME
jgi:hypothetical protein